MWARSELKQRAKAVFNTCYWNAVLVSVILMVVTGAGSGSGGSSGKDNGTAADLLSSPEAAGILALILGASVIAMVIGYAIKIFVAAPVEVGAMRFFMISRESSARVGEVAFGFKNSYGNIVLTQFLRNLFTALWTLLFIVPGIIKAYEYRMIPYILSENPDMNYKDAFRLSKEMMNGEKMNTFVLDLSFLGWILLSLFTCGILAIFYVSPYVNLTNAELYAVLREKVLANGASSTYELKGFSE